MQNYPKIYPQKGVWVIYPDSMVTENGQFTYMLVGGHKVDRKLRVFGPEYECLYSVGVQVTTTFEHVRSEEVNNKRKYTKEFGAGAFSVLRLCEYYSIEGINRAVIEDIFSGGIRCVLRLSKLVLKAITIIKTGTAG